MSHDPYKVLGISSSASREEVKAAYRRLVKEHHPDAGGDKQTILSLNAAWAILGDKENRLAYDCQHEVVNSLGEEAQKRGKRNARARR